MSNDRAWAEPPASPARFTKARAEFERDAYEAKVAARDERKGRAKGKHPKPPDETPRPDQQSHLSDPDMPIRRTVPMVPICRDSTAYPPLISTSERKTSPALASSLAKTESPATQSTSNLEPQVRQTASGATTSEDSFGDRATV